MDLLEIKEIDKNFGGVKALDSVSFSVAKGKIVSLIGPNGAGKTTLFNIINGFLSPDKGRIYFKGIDITGLPPFKIARLGIGRLFQDVRVFPKLTILENILLSNKDNPGEEPRNLFIFPGRVNSNEKEFQKRAIQQLNILQMDIENYEKRFAEDLSYGQQKLISLIRLLASDVELLLLDEPISGIHPRLAKQIACLIKKLSEQGRTIIIIEHNIGAIMEISHQVILLYEGKVSSSGLPGEVREDTQLRKAYLGV